MSESSTMRLYGSLETAYDRLNKELFDGQLPGCILVLQRKKNNYGYFRKEGFIGDLANVKQSYVDEIALNPEHISMRSTLETLGTLAHEMVHQWQHCFGKPSKSVHHNREWAQKMKAVGLKPRGPGGKETGNNVSHEIVTGGPFETVAKGMKLEPCGARIAMTTPTRPRSHVRYVCHKCNLKAYARPRADLSCGDHGQMLEAPGR